jgi:membrane associated rhomboid family serine protease
MAGHPLKHERALVKVSHYHVAVTIELSIPLILIASVVIVSVIAWMIKPLKAAFILHPYSVRERYHVHRLFTAAWVHADTTHLLFNMFTLYSFGDSMVKAIGVVRFLVLYLTAVPVAFLPTTLRHSKNPKYASLGASGAVAAVMFGSILLYPGLKLTLLFIPIPIPGIAYALGYLAYSAWHSWRGKDGINHDAHFSGAVYGAIVTFIFEPQRVMYTVQHFF